MATATCVRLYVINVLVYTSFNRTATGYPKTNKPFPFGQTLLEETEVARTKRLVRLLLATLNLLAHVKEHAPL